MVNKNKKLFQELRLVNLAASSYIKAHVGGCDGDITMPQARLIQYLYDRDGEDVFQRDIEALLAVRRSTVTSILQCMEKNGLITRMGVEGDARMKKLCLTEQAKSIHEFITGQMESAEIQATRGISDAELKTFFCVLDKIHQNLKSI